MTTRIGWKLKGMGIEEIRHAESLTERILFVGGTPVSKPDAEINKKEDIPAMPKMDMALGRQAARQGRCVAFKGRNREVADVMQRTGVAWRHRSPPSPFVSACPTSLFP